jgi:hypothetical protein
MPESLWDPARSPMAVSGAVELGMGEDYEWNITRN